MNIFSRLLLFSLLGGAAHADVTVKLSVKFIHSSTGQPPRTFAGAGNIPTNDAAAFDAEIAHGNRVLDNTGRGYRLEVIEYLNIQPPAPAGQPPDFWYSLDARGNRQMFEDAALADPGIWAWNGFGALNIYINDSTSGQSSFIDNGYSISLGGTIFTRGTVLHEVGHFFNLSHTHGWDPQNPANECVFGDGDGLGETLPDNGCFNTIDQLSIANFGRAYNDPNLGENFIQTMLRRQMLDDTWNNVMSYHVEDRLLPIQMDYWADSANNYRQEVCTGRTWFVKPDGMDIFHDGLSPGAAFASAWRGLAALRDPNYVHLGDDVLLFRAGTYDVTGAEVLDAPGTITASYGPVILTRP